MTINDETPNMKSDFGGAEVAVLITIAFLWVALIGIMLFYSYGLNLEIYSFGKSSLPVPSASGTIQNGGRFIIVENLSSLYHIDMETKNKGDVGSVSIISYYYKSCTEPDRFTKSICRDNKKYYFPYDDSPGCSDHTRPCGDNRIDETNNNHVINTDYVFAGMLPQSAINITIGADCKGTCDFEIYEKAIR